MPSPTIPSLQDTAALPQPSQTLWETTGEQCTDPGTLASNPVLIPARMVLPGALCRKQKRKSPWGTAPGEGAARLAAPGCARAIQTSPPGEPGLAEGGMGNWGSPTTWTSLS